MSIAVSCQIAPWVPLRRPTKKQSIPTRLARTLRLDVALGLRLAWRLVGSRVAGDERQPLRAGVEAVPAQAAPDAVVADDDPAPTLPP